MKYILLSLLALNTQANLKDFVKEYLGQSNEIKKNRFAYDYQALLTELEDEKRPWTLAGSTTYDDSALETSPFSLAPANQKSRTDVLSLSKSFIWGGEFSLSGTNYDLDTSSDVKSYTQAMSYTQDLGANFLGRNDFLSLEIAQETENYQKLVFDGVKSKSIVNLINDYLQVRRDKTLLKLQKDAFARSKKRLNLVKKQVRDGIKEKVDLYSSQTAHSFQTEVLEEKESTLANSLRNLETRMERSVALGSVSKYEISKNGLPVIPTGEIDENIDVKAIKKKISYLNKSIEKSDNSIFPTVSIKGTYTTNNYETTENPISDGTFGSDNDSKAVALTVSIPLGFNVEKNALKVAKLNKMEAEYNRRLTMVSVKNSILNYKRNIERLDKNIASVANRHKLAQKTVREYNRLYNKGRASLDQVIRAEEDLINTETSFVEYKLAREKQYYGLLDIYGQLEAHMVK
jgi:outer membrane protein TolC